MVGEGYLVTNEILVIALSHKMDLLISDLTKISDLGFGTRACKILGLNSPEDSETVPKVLLASENS